MYWYGGGRNIYFKFSEKLARNCETNKNEKAKKMANQKQKLNLYKLKNCLHATIKHINE